MKMRTRKLIGVIVGTIYFIVYCLIAMAIGGAYFTEIHGGIQFVYFVVAGMAWLPGIMLLIRWMSRPDEVSD